jgi:hypothetical protein
MNIINNIYEYCINININNNKKFIINIKKKEEEEEKREKEADKRTRHRKLLFFTTLYQVLIPVLNQDRQIHYRLNYF